MSEEQQREVWKKPLPVDPAAAGRIAFLKKLHTVDEARGEVPQEARAALQVRAAKQWVDYIAGEAMIPRPASDTSREYAIRDFCSELADLLVAESGAGAITAAPGGRLNGLRVRIFDKHVAFQSRVADLDEGDGVTDDASVAPAVDLAAYAVIAALVLRGKW